MWKVIPFYKKEDSELCKEFDTFEEAIKYRKKMAHEDIIFYIDRCD